MVIRLTFDTNCILIENDFKKPYFDAIQKLEDFQKKGFVRILKSGTQDVEIGDYGPRKKKSETILGQVDFLTWGNSNWGSKWFTKEDKLLFENIKKEFDDNRISSEKHINDIKIIFVHLKYRNDFLVTDNIKHFKFVKNRLNLIDPKKIDLNEFSKIKSEKELKSYFRVIKE